MRARVHLLAIAVLASAGALAASCGSSHPQPSTTPDAGDTARDLGVPTDDNGSQSFPCDGCAPFPAFGTRECASTELAASTVAYPLDGILFPPNTNVLEVQFTSVPRATMYEVDFYNGSTKVKVETPCNPVPDIRGGPSLGCAVTLPQAAWNAIANPNRDGDPVRVVVRATSDGSCVSISPQKTDLSFAKEDMAGGIYYWQSATFNGAGGTTGGIFSHDFGTTDPTPTPFYTSGATGTCVGCHVLSRDGLRIALATDDPDADDEFGDVHTHTLDVTSRTDLGGKGISPGFQTFTHDHSRLVTSTFVPRGGRLMPDGGAPAGRDAAFDVYDGDGKSYFTTMYLPQGMLATQPEISADDAYIVFVVPKPGSISEQGDHHFSGGAIYAAAFDAVNASMGTPVPVLADPNFSFYYPSLAPNGKFLVFDVAPQGGANDDAFYNRNAHVMMMKFPTSSGVAAIDLPALNGGSGLTNSWPKWSPFVQTYKGHQLLWIVFSSNRDYGLRLANQSYSNCYPPESPPYDQPQPATRNKVGYAGCATPQLWMAGVLVDDDPSLDAKDRSFAAFWLPFQDLGSHNHCAQWVEKIENQPPPPTCAEAGASCASTPCCSDVVCCPGGTCQPTCVN